MSSWKAAKYLTTHKERNLSKMRIWFRCKGRIYMLRKLMLYFVTSLLRKQISIPINCIRWLRVISKNYEKQGVSFGTIVSVLIDQSWYSRFITIWLNFNLEFSEITTTKVGGDLDERRANWELDDIDSPNSIKVS